MEEQLRDGPRIVVVRGARAAEARLLAEVERVRPRDASQLAVPVRVVVPSKSLRRWVAARLVRPPAGALAGVVVQTLHGLAKEVAERGGGGLRSADEVQEVLIRRLAMGEPALYDGLHHLEDPYAAVVATVRDLLDAGFDEAMEEPLLEQLQSLGSAVPEAPLQRARAIVRVAALLEQGMERLGVPPTTAVLQAAVTDLFADPDGALPARSVIVFGFADVTGVAADLLDALLRRRGATVVLDRPADPARMDEEDAGAVFTSRLLERLRGAAAVEHDPQSQSPAVVEAVAAPTREAEVRWLAGYLRRLLDDGVEPESITVVARDLRPFAAALRRQLDRLGVPFSGAGAEVAGGEVRRRAQALAVLLRRGSATPCDVWLEAVVQHGERQPASELLLGLRTLGVARLRHLHRLQDRPELERGVVLPVATGVAEEEPDRVDHRRLSGPTLRKAVVAGLACARLLDEWCEQASAETHLRTTLELVEALGWDREDEGWTETLIKALGELAGKLPRGWHLEQHEWVRLVAAELDAQGAERLGGAGAGVQVLSVMEARGRTFEHLVIPGLNRDLFPRVVREDPLLPDSVRARMAAVLPDIPVKARGWHEERYLFAALVGSAGNVVITWSGHDGGRQLAPSALVERLRLVAGIEPHQAAAPWSAGATEGPRPAFEHAVQAGLSGDRAAWAAALEAAVEEGRRRAGMAVAVVPAASEVAARLALLDEVDPRRRRDDLSPFAGCVGADLAAGGGEMAVTLAERLAVCGWQTFVTRVLGVLPAPDPLLGLPGLEPRLVGTVVHGVLQAVVMRGAPGPDPGGLGEALRHEPVEVPWPGGAELEELLRRESERVAAEEGLDPAGPAEMLAEVARSFLEVARQLSWSGSEPAVCGAEVDGRLQVQETTLRFRVDRVDLAPAPLLVDYKCGGIFAATIKSAEKRREKVLEAVRRGRLLQGVAYALAVAERGGAASYLYLRPDVQLDDDAVRRIALDTSDEELVEAFIAAVAVLSTAWRQGACFPRVEEAGSGREAPWCRWCVVKQTCHRSDSSFRRRLVRWMDRNTPVAAAARSLSLVERAAAELWWLGTEHG